MSEQFNQKDFDLRHGIFPYEKKAEDEKEVDEEKVEPILTLGEAFAKSAKEREAAGKRIPRMAHEIAKEWDAEDAEKEKKDEKESN